MTTFKDQKTEALCYFKRARVMSEVKNGDLPDLKRHDIPQMIDALDDVLGRAQNGPPDGEADGSIPPQLWTMLSGYVRSMRALAKAEGQLESYLERCLVEFGDAKRPPLDEDDYHDDPEDI
jgi:hypothetical protein